MENCHLSSGNTNNNYSPIPTWNMENQVFCVPERNKCIFLNQNGGTSRLDDVDKEIQWYWDPSTIFQPTAPSSSQPQRQSIKRDLNAIENAMNNNKSMHFDLHDALRQTKVPSVPGPISASPVTDRVIPASITPTLDYFSNDVFFYSNGVFQRPVIHTVTTPPQVIIRNHDLLSESDNDDSEIDSVYSCMENEELRERENVHSQILYDWIC